MEKISVSYLKLPNLSLPINQIPQNYLYIMHAGHWGVFWKKNETLLTANEITTVQDNRFSLEVEKNKYILTLRDIKPKDTGKYVCEAKKSDTEVVDVTHILKVRRKQLELMTIQQITN